MPRPPRSLFPSTLRLLSTTPSLTATPHPLTTAGPPPAPPTPSPYEHNSLLQRKRHQASLIKAAQDLRSAPTPSKPGSALKKRFWKDVHVRQTTPEAHHTITLDSRAVRTPASKEPLQIPKSKPALAAAVALEWDLLVSAAQALRNHFIPLTSLASRAVDIAEQDARKEAAGGGERGKSTPREEIVRVLMRYLDTDTLLCWAPVKSGFGEASGLESSQHRGEGIDGTGTQEASLSLRELQIQTAMPIIAFLTTHVWPGVEIHPALEETGSVMPRPQPQMTKDVIRGWISGLGAWELAGLERAVLAGKSLLVGARLVVEWSERFHGLVGQTSTETARFGIDEAARACSLEVSWQTGMWGEVEDTHDVEKEDLRRQLGSVILLVSGTGQTNV